MNRGEIQERRDAIVARHTQQLREFPNVRLSYWAFQLYKECPQKYIMHAVGDRIPVKKDNYWAIGGSVVHSLWEDFTERLKDGSIEWSDTDFLTDQVPDYYDNFLKEEYVEWRGKDFTPEQHREVVIPEVRNSVTWLYEELKNEGFIPRDPATIHTEWSFVTPLPDVPVELSGRIDLVFEDPDKIDVVDLKDVIKRGNVNWRQLIWYVLGAEPQFEKPVDRAGFLLTKLKDWSWRPPDKRERRETLYKEILDTALKIRRKPFPAKISRHHCGYCPVQQHCPEWQRYSRRSAALTAELESVGEGSIAL